MRLRTSFRTMQGHFQEEEYYPLKTVYMIPGVQCTGDSWKPEGFKKAMASKIDWDYPLPDNLHAEWERWTISISS